MDLNEKAVDVVRRTIDKEIEKMEEVVRVLKARRNRLAAISRLPVEVLSEIFAWRATTHTSDSKQLEWIKEVTHVSRHWRVVAIGCSRLWTSIVFSRPAWVEEMLKRSQIGSLVIDARLGSDPARESVEAACLAVSNISRVRKLTMDAGGDSLHKVFKNVPKSAPILQALVLSASLDRVNMRVLHYTVPSELFGDDTSQLRRLELTDCDLNWASPLLRGLTHLKLHKTSIYTSRPSTALFLDVLRQLPALRSLDLQDVLPEVRDGSSFASRQRIVILPPLKYLNISGSVAECSNALRHLSLSSSAVVKITCQRMTGSSDLSNILTFISGLWGAIPRAGKQHCCPIRSLMVKIDNNTSRGLGLQTWPTQLPKVECAIPSITLQFYGARDWRGDIAQGYVDKVIRETCAALPLDQLVMLGVATDIQLEQRTWASTFGKLASLSSIHVTEASLSSLVSAVTADTISSNSAKWQSLHTVQAALLPGPAVSFPSLRSLTIKNMWLNRKHADFIALKDCLMKRSEKKVQMRSLKLYDCYPLSKECIKELEEIVVNVTYTIKQQPMSPSGESEN